MWPLGATVHAGRMAAVRAVVLALLCAVVLGPPAAAATWTEPMPLLGESVFLWSPVGARMIYGADGRAMAWWPAAVDPMRVHTLTGAREPGGAWRAGAALPAGVIPDFVPYAQTRMIGLEYRETGAGTSNGLYVRFGVLGGSLGQPQRLSRGAYSDVALAANAHGAAVVVAATGRSGATRIRASYRPAGGAFPLVRTISPAWARFPAAAVAADGTAVVVWWRKYGREGRRLVEALFHSPRSGWGGMTRVADLPATEPRLSAAAAAGRFAVSWAAGDISSGGEDEGTRIGAAQRGRDSAWRARTLEARASGGHFDAGGSLVFADRIGRATVVWGGQNPVGVPRVRAARLPNGALVTLRSVSGLPAALADASLVPDGRIAVATAEGARPASQAGVALLPVANIAAGITEPVAAPAIVPSLAVDAAGRRLTLSWGAPAPSEGQQLAPLWTADRPLDP
jgi:hypothetical protein